MTPVTRLKRYGGRSLPLAPARVRTTRRKLASSSSSSPRTTTTTTATTTTRLPGLLPPARPRAFAVAATTFSFPTAGTKTSNASQPSSSNFNWAQQWYPVLCAVTTDAARPHAVQVLGRDLVVWKDTISGNWHAADDACPHRLAPLSEGRIEVRKGKGKGKEGDKSGCEACVLACAYHGKKENLFFSFFIFFLKILLSFLFSPCIAHYQHRTATTPNPKKT